MNEKNNKPKNEAPPFTLAIQEKIFAWLIFDKEADKAIDYVKAEDFKEPVKSMIGLLITFYRKYSRMPEDDEFSQKLGDLIEEEKKKNKYFLEAEYLETYERILSLKSSDLKPSRDLLIKFVKRRAYIKALLKSGEELLQKSDYEGIDEEMRKASATGWEYDGALKTLSDIEAKDVAWLWKNRIPLGEITLLVGDPGVGKSYFSYFLSAQISKGGSWPDAPDVPIESGKVLILSTDEDPNYAIRPRSDAAGADTDKISVLEGSRGETGEIRILNLTKDIRKMEEIFKKDKGYCLWVIDTLTDYLGRLDSHKYSDVRLELMPILALARKYNVAIVGILHCNKNTSLQMLYRIMGSMGFAAVARSIWVIARDREDEEEKRRFFAPLKNNLAPPQKPLAFHLENLGKVAKVVFESEPVEDDFDIEEVLVPQERSSETKRAKKFLLDILKDGAVAMKEIKSAARDEAISWGPLRRAYKKMGVKAFKDKGVSGKWF
ncbi:MAG: AAA family ATPase [Candidatus Aminicenantes bacterium]|nr:AAA family ATPase [Candidatus Aminicenantes bacterium]